MNMKRLCFKIYNSQYFLFSDCSDQMFWHAAPSRAFISMFVMSSLEILQISSLWRMKSSINLTDSTSFMHGSNLIMMASSEKIVRMRRTRLSRLKLNCLFSEEILMEKSTLQHREHINNYHMNPNKLCPSRENLPIRIGWCHWKWYLHISQL